jgi:hypothetical protein
MDCLRQINQTPGSAEKPLPNRFPKKKYDTPKINCLLVVMGSVVLVETLV